MSESQLALLVDLAKLIKKYGPSAFEEMAQDIDRPEFAERLAHLLRASARTGRRAKPAPARSRGSYEQRIAEIEAREPARAALLRDAQRRLLERQTMTRLSDIVVFVQVSGLPPVKARKRDQAASQLLRALLDLPEERLGRLVASFPPVEGEDSGLRGWSDIILNRGDAPTLPAGRARP